MAIPVSIDALINRRIVESNRVACSQSLIFAYQTRRSIVDDRMVRQVLESEA